MTWRTEHLAEGVTLYCGDMLEILPTLGEFDACVTDPPYGIADAPLKGQGRTGNRRGKSNTWHPESWWDVSINSDWPLICANAAPTIAWFGHWRKREQVEKAIPHPLRAEIIWAKDCHVGPPCPVAMRDERIWLFAVEGIKGARFETSVWDHPIIPTWAHKHHKNEKPVSLMARLLEFLNPKAVVDPFMGSGTTGVAAVKQGRGFTGIELESANFETALRRISEALKSPDMFIPAPKPKATQESLL